MTGAGLALALLLAAVAVAYALGWWVRDLQGDLPPEPEPLDGDEWLARYMEEIERRSTPLSRPTSRPQADWWAET